MPALDAHYTMDNISGATIIDETDANNDATLSGVVQTPGLSGQGLLYDNVADYVVLPIFNNTIIGASLFFRYDGSGTWTTLLCRNGGSYHHLLIKTGTHQVCVWNSGEINSGVALIPGNWYHFVVTKNGTNHKIYLDKLLILDTTSFDNAVYPLSMLGNYGTDTPTQGALGIIDNVKIIQGYEWAQADVDILYNEIYAPELLYNNSGMFLVC